MAQVKVGDRVRIADRETTNADVKSGLFYGYFRNLVGKVERAYDDNTVCLDIEIDSLPEDVKIRHMEMQTAARDKWINGLPQEQRNRLSEQDKQFKMSYKVLVASADVAPAKGAAAKATTKADTSAPAAKPKAAEKKADDAPAAKAEAKPAAKAAKSDTAAQRLTEKDLETREQEYLKSLQSKGSKTGEKKAGNA